MAWYSDFNNPTWSPAFTNMISKSIGKNTDAQQNQFEADQAQLARDFNSAEAAKQRDWEEQMSNTQMQRRVADLKAAGLNTALAYSQGGASVPSGATASGSGAHASQGAGLVPLIAPVLTAISSVARTAIEANSARALADKATITDYRNVPGGYRKTTWKE